MSYKIRNRRNQKGQSIVEFALIAPVLILLFMGMFDFGWILHQQIQMDNATRLGARRGAVGDSNSEILTQMLGSMTLTEEQVTISFDVNDPDGVSVGNSEDRTPDNVMWVAIDYPDVPLITPLAALMSSMGTINLHSESEFLIE